LAVAEYNWLNFKLIKMKTNKILSVFLMLGTITVFAQSTDRRELFEFGLKVGGNYSNVWDDQGDAFRADPKFGFAGGVFLGIPLTTFIGIQPEVLISQKGFQGSGNLLGLPYSFSRTTTFLDIPIMLQFKPSEFLTFVAGPQFAYLMRQKDSYTLAGNSTEQQREFENENIRKNILGFVLGADVIYKRARLSGRLGWDFQTNKGDGTSSTPRYKNQWIQVGVGFQI
jgi:hypothetical protein